MNWIYYVEDDESIAYGVEEYLQGKGFQVITDRTAKEAKLRLVKKLPSLCLVDWNLPDVSGEKLCHWIRNKWNDLPIIILTVRGDSNEIVQGFSSGADDYIVKPFDLEVLHSRICALLRRTGRLDDWYLRCGSLSMDKKKLQVFCENEEVNLSALEYQLLLTLMEHKNHTITRQRFLEIIWDANGNFVNDNTLTVTMKRLREKLHNPPCIKTVRSFGYRIEEV